MRRVSGKSKDWLQPSMTTVRLAQCLSVGLAATRNEVPVHVMTTYRVSRGIPTLILNIGTKWSG